MIKSIIQASSNNDSIILDCFLGSGTTVIAANALDRKWIGIDNSNVAIKTTEERLKKNQKDLFEEDIKYHTISL